MYNSFREILNRSVSIPDRSNSSSPIGSIRTEQTVDSGLSRSDTGSGLTSLRYLHLDDIPDMSDVLSRHNSMRSGSDRSSETRGTTSEDVFFSVASHSVPTSTSPSSYYSSSSFTRGLLSSLETDSTLRNGARLSNGHTIAQITSTSSTEIIPSTLSLRGPASASLLGDSHDESTTPNRSMTPSTYSGTSLTRSGGVRRRSAYSSSRSYSSAYLTETEESFDKENSDLYTYSDTHSTSYGPYTLSTLESYSYTASGSETPTLPDTSIPLDTRETPSYRSQTSSIASSISEYVTAKSPTPSAASLPTIPSLSDYDTAEICSTEYETAELCPSEPSASEYETVPICPSEPPTEYVTASICPTEVSGEYETADCRCQEPERVPLPPSPPESSTSSGLSYLDQPEPARYPSPSPGPESTPTMSTISVDKELLDVLPSPSPIPSPLPDPDVTISSPTPVSSSYTQSSLTPSSGLSLSLTSSSDIEISTPSLEGLPTIPSPTITESVWRSGTDESYESSVLRPSPSIQSLGLPHVPDFSFETSHLRPSPSIESEPDLSDMTPLPPIVQPLPISPVILSPTPSPPREPIVPSSLSRTPSSVTISSLPSIPSVPSPTLPNLSLEDVSTEPSLLDTEESAPTPVSVLSYSSASQKLTLLFLDRSTRHTTSTYTLTSNTFDFR